MQRVIIQLSWNHEETIEFAYIARDVIYRTPRTLLYKEIIEWLNRNNAKCYVMGSTELLEQLNRYTKSPSYGVEVINIIDED